MQKVKLVIVGSGGHGRSVAEAAEISAKWREIVFVDDVFEQYKVSGHWPIVAATESLDKVILGNENVIVAIGNQAVRIRFFQKLQSMGAILTTIIHPTAWVSPDAAIGGGVAIMAGAIVGTNATVGHGAIINANATVDHDVSLGNFSHLGVGVHLAGGVAVGDRAWLQAGTCAGYNVKVEADAMVAPGTALIACAG